LIPGFHPAIVPLVVANRNAAGAVAGIPDELRPLTSKLLLERPILKTAPVGNPAGVRGLSGDGTLTTRETMSRALARLYSVASPAPLSAAQAGLPILPGDRARPIGSMRLRSVAFANPGMSDAKLVNWTVASPNAEAGASTVRARSPRPYARGSEQIP
jgi:hypothetical protein